VTVSSPVAELQVVLEGVSLPAGKRELIEHARHEGAEAGLVEMLESLPERRYGSIDEVAETLQPVQPAEPRPEPGEPKPESGLPPGGAAYTDPSPEPGAVRERGPAG
jgi:Protein of unknown function (DUF2795)